MRDDYRGWLEAERYSDGTVSSQISNLRRVERGYGETVDAIVARGGLAGLIDSLTYSQSDERRGRANPSRIDMGGSLAKGLASAKSAVALYARFLGLDLDAQPPEAEQDREIGRDNAPALEKQRLSLERDMQVALREDIARLEPGLVIIDDGAERAVLSGFIDILARDASGAVVVIELKAGKTDARVIGQTLGYMGDIAAEDDAARVRGIIVAHGFDQRTRSAARAVSTLSLVRYAVSFTFAAEE